jgi:DNA-binding NtrC family response regulator
MKMPDVLFIDLGRSEVFSSVLREALRSSSIVRAHLLKFSLETFGTGDVETYLTRLTSFFDPDLIMLVLPAAQLRKIELRLLKSNRFGYIPLTSIDIRPSSDILMVLKAGARSEFLETYNGEGILSIIWSVIGRHSHAAVKSGGHNETEPTPLIGKNILFLGELNKIQRAAACSSGVLIEGEPGTGRKTFAHRIHLLGERAEKPFVRVDCRVVPPDLIEKKLFGQEAKYHGKGASSSHGLIQKAHGGTLFLEEIDRLSPPVQIRLLHLLRTRTFKPLGSEQERPADVRVIGTSANSAQDMMRNNRLRKDFYYALSIISIKLPALRQRREDILPLARHFLNSCFSNSETAAIRFSEEVLRRFAFYDWPGNVTELKYSVERAASKSRTSVIRERDLLLPERDDLPDSLQDAKRKFLTRYMSRFENTLPFERKGFRLVDQSSW